MTLIGKKKYKTPKHSITIDDASTLSRMLASKIIYPNGFIINVKFKSFKQCKAISAEIL